MEVQGQNPSDFYRSIEISNSDALLNKAEHLMPFAISQESGSGEKTEEKHPPNTNQKKRPPIVFRQNPKTLEFVQQSQEDDSGISDSPRTTPEPAQPEALLLGDFDKEFRFENNLANTEVLPSSQTVIDEDGDKNSESEQKVPKVESEEKCEGGGKFEGLAEPDVEASLIR